MKKLMLGMLMIISQQLAMAQYKLSGVVKEKNNNEIAVSGATVEVAGNGTTQTDSEGRFSILLRQKGNYLVRISNVAFKQFEETIAVTEKETKLTATLEAQPLFLKPVEVSAIRAGDRMPFAKTNLNKKEIEKMNLGQDLPFILNQTPSVVINSDAGNGIGYTGIRIRGTDATRINMTLNGIPYNDAESQGLFFVNLPDFSSSVNSIQIQRGVGTSSNGAGAFGATLNLSTNEFNEKPYAELNNGFGSFSSWLHTIKGGTGLINNHVTVDARISFINSKGFIDRGASDLGSAYISAAYINKKSSLRFNAFTGKEKTYQAWLGVPEAKLKRNDSLLLVHYYNNLGQAYFTKEDSINLFRKDNNRTYNSFLYNNQTDNYQQDHYQLFFNQEPNANWNINTAFFLTRGRGYYEEDKQNEYLPDYGLLDSIESNLIRQLWLDNWFYGTTFSAQYKRNNDQLTFGGAYTRYDGKHFGKIIWSQKPVEKDYKWYDLSAYKTDFNFYTKYQRRINNRLEAFADVQYRNVNHVIKGFRKNPSLKSGGNFNFVNPKIGISYADGNGWLGFASFSIGNKEPNRDDFEAGDTLKPKHETLYDFELNIEQRKAMYNWSITGYYMYYNNQLVLTGKVSDVGAYTRTNAAKSYRAGVELQGGVKPTSWFNFVGNLTLSENRILNFTEYIDNYDSVAQRKLPSKKTAISFSPSVVAGFTFNFIPVKNGEISLLNKYVSRQYLDNTGNKARSIDPFFVSDLRLNYALRFKGVKEINLTFQLSNLFDKMYETNGYSFSYIYAAQTVTENYYYPMAGRNFMAGINIKL
jgi:iron complex outermembrane receptor protein